MGTEKSPDLYQESFGGTVTDQGHQQRLDRYSRAKRHQLDVLDYIADDWDLRKEYNAMRSCGSLIVFKHWLLTGFRRLVSGFSCKKHLLCWPCALRRSAGQVREYSLKVAQVLSEQPHLVPVLITRTVKNGADLGERYEHLAAIHKGLITRRRLSLSLKSNARGKSADSVMQYIAGSVGTYEFKRGKNSGDWHPHVHEIALLEPVFEFTDKEVPAWSRDDNGKWRKITRTVECPLDFENRLRREYLEISGDSHMIDVRRIRIGDPEALLDPPSIEDVPDQELSTANTLVKALCEVFKYALKFNGLSHEDQVHAYRTLKGRRLLFSYGCLHGVKLDDNLTDPACEQLEIGPYVYEMYRFLADSYRLTCKMDADAYELYQLRNQHLARFRHLFRRDGIRLPEPTVIDEHLAIRNDAVVDEVPF